ncbi:ferredoxin [Tamaricihabitans halophyticus]|uniref:Ferredoxin n=1 Tax=Tamaricihabitans halophyticus TaxID=1262583 RepID=A0A4R2QV80_9PSEU|nr:ferredoxin [Tamaricihabitans halophyticus]TCP53637.1 ferredoxin [Tamaricihabitans halophyticus]
MKVFVDSGRCQGHGLCNMSAPETFDLDDDGYARVPASEVPDDGGLRTRVRAAVDGCPERALSIEG